MILARQSFFLMLRLLKILLRQPWYVALTLIQPIIWLVLYGQLFRRVAELPGFHSSSYIDFLTPGVVIMSALFSSGWTGMGVINDLDRGVMDRFLISPVERPAIILSRLMNLSFITVVQSLILFGLGALLGARYPGGLLGLLVLLIAAILLGIPFGALSIAMGLTIRKEESVIGAVNFVLLPLTFTSPVFMANSLMPDWMRAVAEFNPVNWSVEAGRGALQGTVGAQSILIRLGYLAAFSAVSAWIANRAFRAYQRSA
ncbi:MAG TPA: ABC transporter permease [Bryobacteraceae bacterium]|jgi:ABC-2 type transport system permease protein|nr:ABC transporter permease [Bryobacteraceae bacterium]